MPPLVRPATPADLAAIGAIYAHYVETGTATFEEAVPSAADWRERLLAAERRPLPFLAALLDGELVGYGYCTPWRGGRSAYRHTVEDTIYVAPGCVGQGVGRALLGRLLDDCAALDVRQVIAVIAQPGEPGPPALHERCGFTRAGVLTGVGHKHGRVLDTLLMQRSLAL